MKLNKTKKSGFHKSRSNLFLLSFLFLLFSPVHVFSQKINFTFNNTPVSEALLEVANKLDIKIAFDAGALKNSRVTKNISGEDVVEVLRLILAETDYRVELKHNTYLVYKLSQNSAYKKRQTSQFTGIVFDAETAERLPYATIYVLSRGIALSTTVDGTFSIRLADSSQVSIQVRYLGYHTLDTIINTNSADRFLALGLSIKTQTINVVEINGENMKMINTGDEAGHLTFHPSRFEDLPNYGETDVFRALQLLPGISSAENSSQLNIRGSSADQNLVLLDGFTLYNLDHFFGVFSALNPNVIKNIQVYRGGFDSRYGERVSGIVDITGKSGNQQKPTVYGGINLISANLTTEIPLSEKFTLVAAGRRAYTDLHSTWLADALLTDKIGQSRRYKKADNIIEPEFYFSDFNAKLTYTPNKKENISLSMYGAKDYLNSSSSSIRNGLTITTEDVNKWGNYGFGLSWKKQHNANYFTNLQFGHSGYFNDYFNRTGFSGEFVPTSIPLDDTVRVTNEENSLTDYFLTFQNRYLVNTKNLFEFGTSLKYNRFNFYKDASTDVVYNNLESSSFLYSIYFQDKINPINSFTIKPGFRLNYYGKTGKVYFEPRLAIRYKLNNGVLFKASTGRYFQFLNKLATEQNYGYNRDFWLLADGEEHPVVSSNHFIVGAGFGVKNFYFDVEGYYKTLNGLQEYLIIQNPGNPSPGNPSSFESRKPILSQFISGSGHAMGIDFLLKYEQPNYTSWLAYSISKSTRNFDEINNGENIPTQFDQTHEIKWTNLYSHDKWNFSSLTIYTTGHPYIENSERDDNFNTLRVYNRLPDYFRIDFSANYNFNIKKVNIKPGVSLLNVLNTQNYLDIYVRNFDFQNIPENETTLVKAQDITLNFFVNFRF